ncbi:hypothetical protein JCM10003_1966 [Bacteroides pyogenes JCM 10003]|nr:hypothetical protein JCM10003_1966 [Bacteroides pyogenes JCM 10003]
MGNKSFNSGKIKFPQWETKPLDICPACCRSIACILPKYFLLVAEVLSACSASISACSSVRHHEASHCANRTRHRRRRTAHGLPKHRVFVVRAAPVDSFGL